MKNKRKNHYKNGWLAVPEKYQHLKENAKKRDPQGSRIKRAKLKSCTAGSTKVQGKRKASVRADGDHGDDRDDGDEGDDVDDESEDEGVEN